MGAQLSQPGASLPAYHGSRSIDHPWPTRPHYPSRPRYESDAGTHSRVCSRSQSNTESSRAETGTADPSSKCTTASTYPPRSTSLSGGSSGSDRPHREVHSSGGKRSYHHNPRGLEAHYDWEKEEGGYIPYQHQAAHRQRWRRELRHAQREEQEQRAKKFDSVEEKKAERRQAYEEHLASKKKHAGQGRLLNPQPDGEGQGWEAL